MRLQVTETITWHIHSTGWSKGCARTILLTLREPREQHPPAPVFRKPALQMRRRWERRTPSHPFPQSPVSAAWAPCPGLVGTRARPRLVTVHSSSYTFLDFTNTSVRIFVCMLARDTGMKLSSLIVYFMLFY